MEQKNNNKILIHACCGICSGYPIALLKEMGYEPVVYFCNPNLDTKEEFDRRLDAQKTVCAFHNVELIVDEYKHQDFLSYVSGLENEPEKGRRCDKCIELRLKQASSKARELGISKFTTSLVISPHKNFDKISKFYILLCQTINQQLRESVRARHVVFATVITARPCAMLFATFAK